MKTVILFRFDREFDICKNHLDLIRYFNPSIEIHGLYGGEKGQRKICENVIGKELESIYSIPNESREWKWKNSDLALIDWYKKVGRNIDFDRLYFIEWDLVIFTSLDKAYKNIPPSFIGLTALNKLKNVEKKWDWTSQDPERSEWRSLLSYAKDNFEYSKEPYASLGPGPCFPRKFLEKYSKIDIPQLCHDELRLPLFAQILGFDLRDTGFYKSWFDKTESKFFNCIPKEISPVTIKKELSKRGGRRVFHPFRKKVDLRIWPPTGF